jgi:hypothetical protein
MAVCPLLCSYGGSPKFASEVSPDRVRAGQSLQLKITATWEGDSTACLLGEVKMELPADLERSGPQPAFSSVAIRDGSPYSTYSYVCSLKPLKPGEFTLDKVEVKFRLPSTKPGEWETWKPPQDIKFAATRSFAVPPGLGIPAAIVGFVLIVAIAAFAGASVRYRRAAREEQEVDMESPVLERLAELRSLRIKGDYKVFFGRLEELAREYLREKYSVESEANEALLVAVERNLDSNTAKRLREVFQLAENVRFGGLPPLPTDMDRAHSVVKDILDRNRPRKRSSPEDEIAFRDS